MSSIAASAGSAPSPAHVERMTVASPATGAARRTELGLRVASSLVLVPVALAATYGGYPWFELMLAALAVAMAFEWAEMTAGVRAARQATAIATAALFAIALAAHGSMAAVAGAIGLAFAAALGLGAVTGDWRTAWKAGGLAYIALPCASMVWLREVPPSGLNLVVWLLVAVWGTDVVAYAVGRTVGGPKLAPRVSPGKTWSGLVGGMLGAGALSALLCAWHGLGAGATGKGFAAGMAIAVVAQGGDLFESALKRRFGRKDSGRLIPGHGGVLDRLDGMLAAAPVMAALVWLAGGDLSAWR
ncbi:MAG: phosphatidate cytidylyltransferase [Alphaproteobacteria bacterium]|nr:phosphatidate cytidylyltransferase [Alphaproteobacteria bacterium]